MWPFKSKASQSALPVFRSLEHQRGLLKAPVAVGNNIHQSCKPGELFAWGIFNPYGPTLSVLSLLNHDESDATLLHYRMLNPFSQKSSVLAVLDRGISSENLNDSIEDLFVYNQLGDCCLVGSLPSFLLFGATQDTAKLALSCFQVHVENNDCMADVRDSLDSFRRFPGNPWDRATGDQKRAFRAIVAEKTGSPVNVDSNASVEFDGDQFVAWVECLMSDEHRLPEMQGFIQAWEGAITFQKGNALAQSALNTRNLLTLLTASCPFMVLQLAEAIRPGHR